MAELNELASRHDEIRDKGIEILALSVEELGENASDSDGAARLASRHKYPFAVGRATAQLLDVFQDLHNRQFPIHRALPLPTSFLIDQHGRLAVIYKGPLSVDALLEDARHSDGSRLQRFARSAPIAGKPIAHPQVAQVAVVWAARLRFLLAYDLQQAGRADEAAEQFGEVLKLMPHSAEAHINRGVALQSLGQWEAAATDFQEALRIEPDQADAHNNLGLSMQGLGHFEAATAHYRAALRIKPEYAEAYHNWGIALESLGQWDDAVAKYQDALRIKPDFAEVHNSWGIALAKQGRLDEAIQHFHQSVQLKPGYSEARTNLLKAQTLLKQNSPATPP